MSKKRKRIISVFLAIVLCFSTSSVAFAAVEPTGNVTVTLSSDKKDYARGEKVTISTNITNGTESEQDVSITYLASGFVRLDKNKDSVSIPAGSTKELKQDAKAWRLIVAQQKHQNIVDGLMGYLWSALYTIFAIFSNNYEILKITVDDCPAVVLAKIDLTEKNESEKPTEPENPTKKYTVSFDLNYSGSENPVSQIIEEGNTATEPVVERENYQLIGWYFSPDNFTDMYDFNTAVTKDIKLFAKWYSENDTKDSDGDGLPDSLEIQFGSDPYDDDTDNDGVNDYLELNWLNTDPNSTNNGSEDADNDGLTNAEESTIGTNPAYYDTDHDGLSDYDEIYKYKTDPLNSDSDNDGVSDGTEVLNGSDPLTAEKEFSTEISVGSVNGSNPVVASATVVTDNKGAGTLEINEVTCSDNCLISNSIPGYLGSAYDFSTDGNLINATLTFEYDESLGTIGEDFQPRIYYVNEATGEFEELSNQIVENGKVTAETTHFSTYILLNKVEFEKVWDTEIAPPLVSGDDNSLDIVFVIDYSGSMTWNDASGIRKKVTKEFISKLRDDEDKAAIVSFISVPTILCNLTKDKETLYDTVDGIVDDDGYSTYAGTNGSNAINTALNVLDASTASNKYIVFLTDGQDTSVSYSYSDLTSKAKSNDIIIYSIGLGDADKELLSEIATSTGGKYYKATTNTDLTDIYDQIESESIDLTTDSNNDGIPDYYAELINDGKLLLSNGADDLVGVIDKYGDSADWDGDGLLNGEEIQIVTQSNGSVAIKMKSHPLVIDSDGDDYDDYTEIKEMKTNPLKITKKGGYDISSLRNDNAYVYSEQVNSNNLANQIFGIFDWKKTDESKETFINYFYDYASEKSINKNSNEIEKLSQREKAWEVIETIVKIIKLGKNVTDLGTDLGSYDQNVKGQITRYNNKHSDALSLYNKKDYDAVIKKYGDVKDFNDGLKTFNNVIDVIGKQGVIDKVDKAVSVASAVVKNIDGLKKVKINLGSKLNNFSNKYQRWLGQRPTGDISYGTVISVATEGIDLATSIANINNCYGKLRANSEAFEEYIELIEYISTHGNGKDYIKNAAGDVVKIVLDKSYTEFYKQLNTAIAKESAESFIKITISIVGDFCPYVKVANTILTVIKAAISITGMPAYAKALVKAQCIDSISDGCIYFLSTLINVSGDYYDYGENDTDSVNLYLIQLTQSRIVGEKSICDYLKTGSLINWISKLISHTSNKETDQNFGIIINGIYSYADELNLTLSPNLPKFVNGNWAKNSTVTGGGGGGSSW